MIRTRNRYFQLPRESLLITLTVLLATNGLFGQDFEYAPVPGDILNSNSSIELRQLIPTQLGFRDGFSYALGYELFANVKKTVFAGSAQSLAGYNFARQEGFVHSQVSAYVFPFLIGQSLDFSGSVGLETYTSFGIGFGVYELQVRIPDIQESKYFRLELTIAFVLFQRDNGTIAIYP